MKAAVDLRLPDPSEPLQLHILRQTAHCFPRLTATCGCVHVSVCFGAVGLTSSMLCLGWVQHPYFRRVLGHVMYDRIVCSTTYTLHLLLPRLPPSFSSLLLSTWWCFISHASLPRWWNSLNSNSNSLTLYHFCSLFSLLFLVSLFVFSPPLSLIQLWAQVQLDLVLVYSNHVITPRHPTAPSGLQSIHVREMTEQSGLFVCMCVRGDYEMWRGYTCTVCGMEGDVIIYWWGTDQSYSFFMPLKS